MKTYKYAIGLGMLYRYRGLKDAGEFWCAAAGKWMPSSDSISVAECVQKLDWPVLTRNQATAGFPEAFQSRTLAFRV